MVNSNDDPKTWWQVFDRTTGNEVPKEQWTFNSSNGTVTISKVQKWHKYTVNFFAYRIWEGSRVALAQLDIAVADQQNVVNLCVVRWRHLVDRDIGE